MSYNFKVSFIIPKQLLFTSKNIKVSFSLTISIVSKIPSCEVVLTASLQFAINLFISKRNNYNGNEYKQYTGKDVIEREQESCVDRKLS